MKTPFPYFGGKSKVAADIWAALGTGPDAPKHYLEPFFGSGAVLLGRPDWRPEMTETVCDKDGYLANVWRALQADPDAVARWCDWPVNHADLCARRRVLLREGAGMTERLIADDAWFDAKLAGYWVWAASCWIGRGLTRTGAVPHVMNQGKGVHASGVGKRPHLGAIHGGGGTGVHAGQVPHLRDGGTGVHAGQVPFVGHGGRGVHAGGGTGILPVSPDHGLEGRATLDVRDPYKPGLYRWFRELAERLRNVRVVCGDWSRICGGNWQDMMGVAGIFLDPPYGDVGRDPGIYHQESLTVAAEAAAWAVARGDRPSYRIVMAGYEGEHQVLIDAGWRVQAWKAGGGYANIAGNDARNNRHRERLFYSPHCLGAADRPLSAAESPLFAGVDHG